MNKEYVVTDSFGFDHYDKQKGVKLIRIDKNGTHYYHDSRCPKCGGYGYLNGYEHVEGGVCFLCGGSGRHDSNFVVRTKEYAEKLAERRLEKARKGAKEANSKFFKKLGLSEFGTAYVVLGNTFDIRDELKADGAKFSNSFGWHFDHEQDKYDTFALTPETSWEDEYEGEMTFMHVDEAGRYILADDACIQKYVRDKQEIYAASKAPETFYVGNVGDKILIDVTYEHQASYEVSFGYSTTTQYIYTFKDSEGNVFVWKTANILEKMVGDTYEMINIGERIKIKGTVKEHSEYKHRKQTVLTRCKIVA